MIDTLIFDFDGLIIDTETPDYLTWQDVFRSYGVELDRSLWSNLIGGGTERFDVYEHLEELSGIKVDREAVGGPRRQRYLRLVESSPVLPGVMEYIGEAERLGLKLGVASSSSRDWVEGHLARLDLLKYMASVTCRDDVSNVKPDPEIYLTAVSRLTTQPNAALAIEDSANGIAAAKRAGLYCVAVPNQMTRTLPMDQADIRLNSLSDIGLSSLLAMIAEKDRDAEFS